MAISNKFGWLVLTTGNKSEMATGYSTLYGDMAGGFAVIKDVPKMLVYALSAGPQPSGPAATLIPRVGAREAAERRAAPGPEGRGLAARRTTVLDPILEGYVEERPVGRGDRGRRLRPRHGRRGSIALVDRNEYKRRQAPPGVRVSREGLRQGPPAARSRTAGRAEPRCPA